jgi:UDP-sulfoquinovose synthase
MLDKLSGKWRLDERGGINISLLVDGNWQKHIPKSHRIEEIGEQMKVLILGGDGYLGWPTAMYMAVRGHEVHVVDNYLSRKIALSTDSESLNQCPVLQERSNLFKNLTGQRVNVNIGNCADYRVLGRIFRELLPDAVIHYAEQPSAPYSMKGFEEAQLTLNNNLNTTFNLIWAVKENRPDCHIIKLGTMGEYGTPGIDIEEGWLEVSHKCKTHTFLYPREAGSFYHTTKVLDTDMLWFYVRTYGLQVTDLMQGPVYGLFTEESSLDDRLLPHFSYDDLFGTVVNRFITQVAADVPLTVYGQGGQTRGYLNIKDTLQCVELAMMNPAGQGNLRILNQLTELFTVNELAEKVTAAGRSMGLNPQLKHIDNPRKELEEHYYNPKYSGLLELGLNPNYMTKDVLVDMLEWVLKHKDKIDEKKISPRVRWA